MNSEEFHPKLTVSTKALNPKIPESNRLITEIMSQTKFDDRERIREIIQELKSRMEIIIMNSGHQVASMRLLSYLSSMGMYHEITGGLEFYRFVSRLDKDFDGQFDRIKVILENILVSLYNKRDLVVGMTTEKDEISIQIKKERSDIANRKLLLILTETGAFIFSRYKRSGVCVVFFTRHQII